MKKEHILWTSICLLLAVVPARVDSAVEEDKEFTNTTDMKLPPLKPVQTFCAMKVDDGPCRAFIKRYFFNILTHQCEEFIYGGCEGNENRFVSLEECEENCVRDHSKMTTKLTLQKGKPDFCFLEEDPGICRGYITRYFYNNQSKQCERFKYGGCLGNLNNFESLEECKSTCEDPDNTAQRNEISAVNDTLAPQPTKASRLWEFHGPSWCLSPADPGQCQANEIRFYYNANTGRCRPFKYSGCGGNENNFTSKKACFTNCKKGFIRRLSKGGLIKTKRKRKKQSRKTVHEEVFINKT